MTHLDCTGRSLRQRNVWHLAGMRRSITTWRQPEAAVAALPSRPGNATIDSMRDFATRTEVAMLGLLLGWAIGLWYVFGDHHSAGLLVVVGFGGAALFVLIGRVFTTTIGIASMWATLGAVIGSVGQFFQGRPAIGVVLLLHAVLWWLVGQFLGRLIGNSALWPRSPNRRRIRSVLDDRDHGEGRPVGSAPGFFGVADVTMLDKGGPGRLIWFGNGDSVFYVDTGVSWRFGKGQWRGSRIETGSLLKQIPGIDPSMDAFVLQGPMVYFAPDVFVQPEGDPESWWDFLEVNDLATTVSGPVGPRRALRSPQAMETDGGERTVEEMQRLASSGDDVAQIQLWFATGSPVRNPDELVEGTLYALSFDLAEYRGHYVGRRWEGFPDLDDDPAIDTWHTFEAAESGSDSIGKAGVRIRESDIREASHPEVVVPPAAQTEVRRVLDGRRAKYLAWERRRRSRKHR